MKKLRVLVTGANGLVGKNYIRHALRLGHEVFAVVRNPDQFKLLPQGHVFKWSHTELLPAESLKNIDAVIHLAGENIADTSWTKQRKKTIVESRLVGTKNIVDSLNQLPDQEKPKVFISGSAIGYYGYNRTEQLTEKSSPANDFLADLCVLWEAEALKAQASGIRVALLRTGIVVSREGGALTKMPPVQISDGQSWMSWIHIEDMVSAIQFAIENESISGPMNCVSPEPLQNKDFTKELAKAYKVPHIGFVPKFILSAVLGEVSQVLLSSLKVRPELLLSTGFKFQFNDLKSALQKELHNTHLLDVHFFKDQFVPSSPERIYPFFSKAENLETLTPPWLNFKITSKSTEDVSQGTLIDYKLKIHGVPIKWRTLIKEWEVNKYFVDEQLKGPYKKWYHLHTFEPVNGGCLVRDEVTYRVPFSILGKLLLSKWISKDVNQIFSYRQKRIQDMFSKN